MCSFLFIANCAHTICRRYIISRLEHIFLCTVYVGWVANFSPCALSYTLENFRKMKRRV